jgi:hypothetical protein
VALLTAGALILFQARASANVIFVSGNLRTNANVTACGTGCTLGPSNSDGDYAQWAAVVTDFNVSVTTTMEAITYSYGGGASLTGAIVPTGGLEPYLSLFDAGGNFIASTLFGTTCPPGANSLGSNCFDVSLDGGTLTPGTYEIALTAFENQSVAENPGGGLHLSDGFSGLGNLAPGENFNYAFDILLPQNVSEPAPAGLFAIGCGVPAWRVRRRFARHSR